MEFLNLDFEGLETQVFASLVGSRQSDDTWIDPCRFVARFADKDTFILRDSELKYFSNQERYDECYRNEEVPRYFNC